MTEQPLRPYQQRAVQTLDKAKRNILMVAPTGSGKTRILIEDARRHSGPILMLCPWRTLIYQSADYFDRMGVSAGILLNQRKPKPSDKVVVTTIQTAVRRDLGSFRRIYFDEAHGAVTNTAEKVLGRYPNALIIGATATACRLDGKPLARIFHDLFEAATPAELIEHHFLVPPLVYGPPNGPPDTSTIDYDSRKRDYAIGSAGRVMGQATLIGDAIQHWKRLASGKSTFAYCCHLEHAKNVKQRFEAAGVPSDIVSGSTCQSEREALLARLESGEIKVLCNVGVLTEGVDFPPLQCMLILRPTLSFGLHRQMIGRGLRTAPGKSHCLYLDHAGNFLRHGFPQDPTKWSLKPRPIKTRKEVESRPPQAQICPKCGAIIPLGTHVCPSCHWIALPQEIPGQLKRIPFKQTVRVIGS